MLRIKHWWIYSLVSGTGGWRGHKEVLWHNTGHLTWAHFFPSHPHACVSTMSRFWQVSHTCHSSFCSESLLGCAFYLDSFSCLLAQLRLLTLSFQLKSCLSSLQPIWAVLMVLQRSVSLKRAPVPWEQELVCFYELPPNTQNSFRYTIGVGDVSILMIY